MGARALARLSGVRRLGTAVVAVAFAACGSSEPISDPSAPSTIELASGFPAMGEIPGSFTCDGRDSSPPIRWTGVPRGARDLLVLMRDSDARDFVHWVIWGIEAEASGGFAARALPAGAREGTNDFGKIGYGGPCPPEGAPHEYVLTIFALREPLGAERGARARDVLREAEPLVLAQGKLSARYGRAKG